MQTWVDIAQMYTDISHARSHTLSMCAFVCVCKCVCTCQRVYLVRVHVHVGASVYVCMCVYTLNDVVA
jgi:hypothetical protein